MKRILLLAVATAACSPQTSRSTAPDSVDLAPAAATITAADMYDRIAFLASDRLRGRDTPSEGLDSAARWIADELSASGVEPAGEEGWFQRYPYPQEALDPGRTTFAGVAGTTHSFEYGRDYFAEAGATAPASAVGAVYVGGELDASTGELRDRAVVTPLEGLPEPGGRGFGFGRATRQRIAAMEAAAREAGAAAVVFLLDPRMTAGEVQALAEAAETPRRVLGRLADEDRPLPTFFVARPAADRLFRMAGLEPRSVYEERVARPVPLSGLALLLAAPVRTLDDRRPPNVVGVLRGSDPELRASYVVLSAHMDGVGVGPPDETGDSIYNGADDDATGTAILVEVAEALSRLETAPARSVVFLAVSGEEKGLLGSRWFTDHPTIPLDSVVANINIDMVGRNAPDSIVVIGQEFSSLGPLVHQVARHRDEEVGLTVAEDLWPEERFFFRSDHFNFARKEIPALFFFAGTHEDYHRPGDEVAEIDTDKTARVGRLVFYLTHAVASDPSAPRWDPRGLETVRRLTRP